MKNFGNENGAYATDPMTFVSYAQNFEDLRLWRALGNIQSGCYLDIGAQHPVTDSVSKAFYDLGWRGAHVEATAAYAAALRECRPDEPVFELVVGSQHGSMMFYEFPETGISTGIAEIAHKHSQAGYEVRIRELPMVPLSQVFVDFGAQTIHWMKIDVEGMERQVLESWGNATIKPWILVIESVDPFTHESTHPEWIELVLARGYQDVAFDGLNRYFVADEHAEFRRALAMPPNIFDGFHVTRCHFSALGMAAEERSATAALEAAVAQAQAETGAVQARAAELEARADAAGARTAELEASAAQLEQRRASLEAQLATMELNSAKIADELSLKLSHLVSELVEANASHAALSAELGELKLSRDATLQALNDLRSSVAQFNEAIAADRATRISEVQQALDDLCKAWPWNQKRAVMTLSARIEALRTEAALPVGLRTE